MFVVIVNGAEGCIILVIPGSRIYMFYSDEKKAKMCQVIMTEQVRLPSGCIFTRERATWEWWVEREPRVVVSFISYPWKRGFEECSGIGYGDSMQQNI